MKKLAAFLLAAVVLLGLAACGVNSDEVTTFSAGYGKVDVTPFSPVHLGSYGDALDRLSTGVRDAFYAITVAITDSNGDTVLFIVTDLSWGHMNQLTPLRAVIEEKFGIPGDHVMLGGTHNHNGPEWQNEGAQEPENIVYLEFWQDGVVKSVEQALNDRKPATIEIGRTETEGLGFVRRYYREDGNLIGGGLSETYVQSDSPIKEHESPGDEEVQMVKFVREGAKDILVGQWQNHGCHDPKTTIASTDWIGYTRKKIEAELDCHFIYMQGAAGNMATTSWITDEYPVAKSTQQVGEEVAQVMIDAYNDPNTFKKVNSGLVKTKQIQYTDVTARNNAEWTAELDIIGIGDISFVTLPVELFAESGVAIKEQTPYEMTVIMGYANGICSYVGTRLAFQNGGYGIVDGRGTEDSADKMVAAYVGALKELHE